MLIHEFVRLSGLSRTTVRFYERRGLLKPQSAGASNGYRHYGSEQVERVHMIRLAQSLGFSIAEIARLLHAWDDNKLTVEDQRSILKIKLAEVRQKRADLELIEQYISAKLAWMDAGQQGPAPDLIALRRS
jgi:MerR family transcriptional regulator, copper efflux regulator